MNLPVTYSELLLRHRLIYRLAGLAHPRHTLSAETLAQPAASAALVGSEQPAGKLPEPAGIYAGVPRQGAGNIPGCVWSTRRAP